MIGAESGPGIHGGISPAFVIRTIPAACARRVRGGRQRERCDAAEAMA